MFQNLKSNNVHVCMLVRCMFMYIVSIYINVVICGNSITTAAMTAIYQFYFLLSSKRLICEEYHNRNLIQLSITHFTILYLFLQ